MADGDVQVRWWSGWPKEGAAQHVTGAGNDYVELASDKLILEVELRGIDGYRTIELDGVELASKPHLIRRVVTTPNLLVRDLTAWPLKGDVPHTLKIYLPYDDVREFTLGVGEDRNIEE